MLEWLHREQGEGHQQWAPGQQLQEAIGKSHKQCVCVSKHFLNGWVYIPCMALY